MDTQVAKLLADYNKKTNEEMNRLIERLSPEQWDREFGGHFGSIHALCSHLYIADFNWLKRFRNLREFDYLNHDSFRIELGWTSSPFVGQADYLAKRSSLDLRFLELVSEISDEDFGKTLVFKTSKGIEQKRNFGGTILHVFNHQTHHRGMISLYLDSLGIENDYSNLILMV
jgi:uncharacterized damage-inducible protein DinB